MSLTCTTIDCGGFYINWLNSIIFLLALLSSVYWIRVYSAANSQSPLVYFVLSVEPTILKMSCVKMSKWTKVVC